MDWAWLARDRMMWWFRGIIGMCTEVEQNLLTRRYSRSPAAHVGAFTYGNGVFAAVLGWLFWGESLDSMTWVGAFLICIAGIITTRRTKTHALLGTTARTTAYVDEESAG